MTGELAIIEVAIIKWVQDCCGVDLAAILRAASASIVKERCRLLAMLRGHVAYLRKVTASRGESLALLDDHLGYVLNRDSNGSL